MLADILAMPEHLGDALWRVESAAIEPVDTPGGLIVAGMGGSAIGGAVAPAALRGHAPRAGPRRRSRALSRPAPWARGGSSSPPAASSPSRPATSACR